MCAEAVHDNRSWFLRHKLEIIGSSLASSSVGLITIGIGLILGNSGLDIEKIGINIELESIFLFLGGLFLILATRGTISRIRRRSLSREEKSDWLWAHSALHFFTDLNILVVFLTLALIFYTYPANGKAISLVVVSMILGLMVLVVYGVNYSLCVGLGQDYPGMLSLYSMYGASSLASFASRSISEDRTVGEAYLRRAVEMLRKSLKADDLTIDGMDELVAVLQVSHMYEQNVIPTENMQELAQTLSLLPDIECLSTSITNFGRFVGWKNKLRVSYLFDRQISKAEIITILLSAGILVVSFSGSGFGLALLAPLLATQQLQTETVLGIFGAVFLLLLYLLLGVLSKSDLDIVDLYRHRKHL